MKPPIDFYFDFSSPYGYFAAKQIDAISAKHGRNVTWHPILLGAIFKISGQQPLASIPLKGDYMKRDLERYSRLLNIPYKLPTKFPIAGTTPSRAFYWLADRDPAAAKRLALALYHAYFAENRDISAPQTTLDVAAMMGIGMTELEHALGDNSVKDRLRKEVDAAIAKGIFGSPYIIIDGEPFWGSDRLDQVERWLTSPW